MQDQQISKKPDRREFLKLGACAGIGLVLVEAGLSCCPKLSKHTATASKGDKYAMVAYCCLKCDECDAYIATKNNDNQLRAAVATRWNMQPEQINCNGCKSPNPLFNCSAKKCAEQKKVPTCAHCDEFPTCTNEQWSKWPTLRENVEKFRKELKG